MSYLLPFFKDKCVNKIILPETAELIFIALKMEIPIRGWKGIAPSFLIFRDQGDPAGIGTLPFQAGCRDVKGPVPRSLSISSAGMFTFLCVNDGNTGSSITSSLSTIFLIGSG